MQIALRDYERDSTNSTKLQRVIFMAITSEKNVRSGALVKTYFKIAELWNLTLEEQTAFLGMPPNSGTYTSWKNIPSSAILDKDKLLKLTLIMAIYKDVQEMFPGGTDSQIWLRKPISEAPFNGVSPVEFLMAGKIPNLILVRQYLTEKKDP